MRPSRLTAAVFAIIAALLPAVSSGQTAKYPIGPAWTLQSSARVAAGGAQLSRVGYETEGWNRIRVPNTVVGALVENGTYKDPYFGMNLRGLPGMDYPIGQRFTLIDTPKDSPFKPAWWYRTEFEVPASQGGRTYALHFDGINYRANIWVNGRQIANSKDVVGVFRRYEFDVTPLVQAGARNALAVEVFGPEPHDLSIMWVDWNPTPPDKNMGLWADVYLTTSGPLALRHPHVVPALTVPSLATADLTVTAEVWNRSDAPVKGTVRGAIESIRLSREVTLAPREKATVRFTPKDTPDLRIRNPRVWWPYRHGNQELYSLALEVDAGGERSDEVKVTFGIQHVASEVTKDGGRLFKVNGKPILIRGGGWASDMLLRPITTERAEAELRYVKEMGLNTIRLEGKLETDEFYDLADREGILLMPGWCCCDQWEMWDKWDAEDHRVGPASLRDQAIRIRNHPSVISWMNGSDFPPPAKVEQAYLDVLEQCEWSKPIVSNATDAPGPVSGPSGMKMKGPYDYVPPSYWLTDTKNGGAWGFASEISPGAAVPPIESLRAMLPEKSLWPIDEVWKFHAGGDEFKDLQRFTQALEGRYGKATSAEDYARKAQALTYEGQRAMFEGFARNKYRSTGVIQWMLNNAWPSMIWHLYDYYLRPGGGYFGTKKANEPLHVQYSYDDRSIAVVNDLYEAVKGLTVAAEVLDFNLASKFKREMPVDIGPDAVVRPFQIPELKELTATYFVRLTLRDSNGREISRNFYWLSVKDDILDWKNTKWYYTPTSRHADLTALSTLPPTTLSVTPQFDSASGSSGARITVRNTGKALAFQIRLKAIDSATGNEMLPVFWEDNYFELLPGESREIRVTYPPATAQPRIEVEGWNVRTS
jgi:exo-1,4-beta-D-glucosaminidase